MRSPDHHEGPGLLHTLCFLPAPLTYGSMVEPDDSENGSRFFRVLALTSNLALYSALCVAHIAVHGRSKMPEFWTIPPTLKLKQKNKHFRSDRTVHSGFIVPDGLDEEAYAPSRDGFMGSHSSQKRDDLHLRMDWREIFRHVFPPIDLKELQSHPQTPDESSSMTRLLDGISARLQDAKDANSLTMATL
jgi:hypothetical protein